MENSLLNHCEQVAQSWMASSIYDEETKQAVRAMLDNDDKTELIDAFYQTLNLAPAACAASWAPVPTA